MRTIKFRGKRLDNGEWVYGFLADGNLICTWDNRRNFHEVLPTTVGQFTGLHDINGKEIYEGDLLISHENGEVFEVVYDAPRFCFKDNDFGFRFFNHPEFFGVCGNVFDDK